MYLPKCVAIDGTSDLSNSSHHACNSDVDTSQAQRDNVRLPEFEFPFASEVKKLVRILKDYPWSVLVALDGMFIATSKIRNSLWPQNLKPPHTFTTIKRRHLIHNDLTVSSYSEHHVKALSGPVHYFVWSVGSETEATPVDHLLEVDFRVKDITPGGNFETAYLQSENEPHGKEVLIYFLPLLQPSESTPRIIEITHVWPGY